MNTSSGYNIYDSFPAHPITNYSVSYLTFVLISFKNIDSVSITITETYASNIDPMSSGGKTYNESNIVLFLIIICVVFCIAFVIVRILY